MNQLPKISIITPSLNMGGFIEDAILSVLNQGYDNFEHIIVDGLSSDNTLDILRSYPHLRWVSERDKNQSDAINKGFQMATGELVAWLNADEYYLPGALEAIGLTAVKHSEVDVFYGDTIFVADDGKLQRSKTAHGFSFPTLLYYGCYIGSDATFIRRKLIEDGFLVDIKYRVVMDFEYYVRFASSGKRFKYINRLLGAFRWHGHNLSLDDVNRRKERLMVQRRFSPIKLPDAGYDALCLLWKAYRQVLKTCNGNFRSERQALAMAGAETRWFRYEEGNRTCAVLVP